MRSFRKTFIAIAIETECADFKQQREYCDNYCHKDKHDLPGYGISSIAFIQQISLHLLFHLMASLKYVCPRCEVTE